MSEPHVVLRPPNTFFCLHCGETYEMNLPAPVDVMVGAMGSFSKTHKKCKLTERGLACEFCFEFGHAPDKCSRLKYGGDWRRWKEGPDTGASSLTLCRALAHGPDVIHQSIDTPRDASDFGRCYRLLKAIPGWRQRIGEVRHLVGWAPLVDAWDDLERLFEEATTSGNFEPFNERMRGIEAAQRKERGRR
jgi:hypothetical protein